MLKTLPITALLLMLAGPPMLVVPQTPAGGPNAQHPVASAEMPVDINHASLEQLLQVTGLTRPWAERIVRLRPYKSKLDLVQEGVLPGEVYNRIKDSIIAHRDKK